MNNLLPSLEPINQHSKEIQPTPELTAEQVRAIAESLRESLATNSALSELAGISTNELLLLTQSIAQDESVDPQGLALLSIITGLRQLKGDWEIQRNDNPRVHILETEVEGGENEVNQEGNQAGTFGDLVLDEEFLPDPDVDPSAIETVDSSLPDSGELKQEIAQARSEIAQQDTPTLTEGELVIIDQLEDIRKGIKSTPEFQLFVKYEEGNKSEFLNNLIAKSNDLTQTYDYVAVLCEVAGFEYSHEESSAKEQLDGRKELIAKAKEIALRQAIDTLSLTPIKEENRETVQNGIYASLVSQYTDRVGFTSRMAEQQTPSNKLDAIKMKIANVIPATFTGGSQDLIRRMTQFPLPGINNAHNLLGLQAPEAYADLVVELINEATTNLEVITLDTTVTPETVFEKIATKLAQVLAQQKVLGSRFVFKEQNLVNALTSIANYESSDALLNDLQNANGDYSNASAYLKDVSVFIANSANQQLNLVKTTSLAGESTTLYEKISQSVGDDGISPYSQKGKGIVTIARQVLRANPLTIGLMSVAGSVMTAGLAFEATMAKTRGVDKQFKALLETIPNYDNLSPSQKLANLVEFSKGLAKYSEEQASISAEHKKHISGIGLIKEAVVKTAGLSSIARDIALWQGKIEGLNPSDIVSLSNMLMVEITNVTSELREEGVLIAPTITPTDLNMNTNVDLGEVNIGEFARDYAGNYLQIALANTVSGAITSVVIEGAGNMVSPISGGATTDVVGNRVDGIIGAYENASSRLMHMADVAERGAKQFDSRLSQADQVIADIRKGVSNSISGTIDYYQSGGRVNAQEVPDEILNQSTNPNPSANPETQNNEPPVYNAVELPNLEESGLPARESINPEYVAFNTTSEAGPEYLAPFVGSLREQGNQATQPSSPINAQTIEIPEPPAPPFDPDTTRQNTTPSTSTIPNIAEPKPTPQSATVTINNGIAPETAQIQIPQGSSINEAIQRSQETGILPTGEILSVSSTQPRTSESQSGQSISPIPDTSDILTSSQPQSPSARINTGTKPLFETNPFGFGGDSVVEQPVVPAQSQNFQDLSPFSSTPTPATIQVDTGSQAPLFDQNPFRETTPSSNSQTPILDSIPNPSIPSTLPITGEALTPEALVANTAITDGGKIIRVLDGEGKTRTFRLTGANTPEQTATYLQKQGFTLIPLKESSIGSNTSSSGETRSNPQIPDEISATSFVPRANPVESTSALPKFNANPTLTEALKTGTFFDTLPYAPDQRFAVEQTLISLDQLSDAGYANVQYIASLVAQGNSIPTELADKQLPTNLPSSIDSKGVRLTGAQLEAILKSMPPEEVKKIADASSTTAVGRIFVQAAHKGSILVLPLPGMFVGSGKVEGNIRPEVIGRQSMTTADGFDLPKAQTETQAPSQMPNSSGAIVTREGDVMKITYPLFSNLSVLAEQNTIKLNTAQNTYSITDPSLASKISSGNANAIDILDYVYSVNPNDSLVNNSIDMSHAKNEPVMIDIEGQKIDLLDVVARQANNFFELRKDGQSVNNPNNAPVLNKNGVGLVLYLLSDQSSLSQAEKSSLLEQIRQAPVGNIDNLANPKSALLIASRHHLAESAPALLESNRVYGSQLQQGLSGITLDSAQSAKNALIQQLRDVYTNQFARRFGQYYYKEGSPINPLTADESLLLEAVENGIQNLRTDGAKKSINLTEGELRTIMSSSQSMVKGVGEINALMEILDQKDEQITKTSSSGMGLGLNGLSFRTSGSAEYTNTAVTTPEQNDRILELLEKNPKLKVRSEQASLIGALPLPGVNTSELLKKLGIGAVAGLTNLPGMIMASGSTTTTISELPDITPEMLEARDRILEATAGALQDKELAQRFRAGVQGTGNNGLTPQQALVSALQSGTEGSGSSTRYYLEFDGKKHYFSSLQERNTAIHTISLALNEIRVGVSGQVLDSKGRTTTKLDVVQGSSIDTYVSGIVDTFPIEGMKESVISDARAISQEYSQSLQQAFDMLNPRTWTDIPDTYKKTYTATEFYKEFGFYPTGAGVFGDGKGGLKTEGFMATRSDQTLSFDSRELQALKDGTLTTPLKVVLDPCDNGGFSGWMRQIPSQVAPGREVGVGYTPPETVESFYGRIIKKADEAYFAFFVRTPQGTPDKPDEPDQPEPEKPQPEQPKPEPKAPDSVTEATIETPTPQAQPPGQPATPSASPTTDGGIPTADPLVPNPTAPAPAQPGLPPSPTTPVSPSAPTGPVAPNPVSPAPGAPGLPASPNAPVTPSAPTGPVVPNPVSPAPAPTPVAPNPIPTAPVAPAPISPAPAPVGPVTPPITPPSAPIAPVTPIPTAPVAPAPAPISPAPAPVGPVTPPITPPSAPIAPVTPIPTAPVAPIAPSAPTGVIEGVVTPGNIIDPL